MAEEETQQKDADAENGEGKKGSKAKILMIGGVVGVIGAGAMAAMMALPSTEKKPRMAGPFAMPLFPDQFTCNIEGAGRTRFLLMKPQADYYAYDPTYLSVRVSDELYPAALQDTVFRIASRKTIDEVYGDVNKSTFAEELRDALDPVLFPVHIGPTTLPWDPDEDSGLRPGLSSNKNTFRGQFEDHLLYVDTDAGEMWVDDGPKTIFSVGEFDVRVISAEGEVLYVDVSGVVDDFDGEVKVGARGRILRIITAGLMVQ